MNTKPVFAISPKHTTEEFPNGLALEDMIDVFIARIEGWQIGVAKEIIQKEIPHRGFALLQIVFSYFEMIGKYYSGYIREDKSRYFFGKGVTATFPEIETEAVEFLTVFYTCVRNGLYHIGMTKPNVILTDDIPGSIAFHPVKKLLAISPDRFINDLAYKFQIYSEALRNPINVDLRENFRRRFEHDNS